MNRSIEKLRHEYGNAPLLENDLKTDPLDQFRSWLKEAVHANVFEPNGMTLATISSVGHPSSRTVLLKDIDEQGFYFYTNYESRKGEHLNLHPVASLTFWWKEIFRQVNIEGRVHKVDRKTSVRYFQKRPKKAQIAAIASLQSAPLASREQIDEVFARLLKLYRGKPVPCPKQWGGYCLEPDRMEFWQGRQSRLHDRLVYIKTDGEWLITRLSP